MTCFHWSTLGKGASLGMLLVLSPLRLEAVGHDFSVRWADDGQTAGGSISLHAACDPYGCGLGEVGERVLPRAALRASIAPGTVYRGEAPAEGDAWWVVVEGDGRMPMAMLWRPPVAGGDLESAPVLNAGACRIRVKDADGAGVAGARLTASPALGASGSNRSGRRPAVFSGWRPWYQPVRTDADGRGNYAVPESTVAMVLVRARGFRLAEAACAPGRGVLVVLQRREQRTFKVQDESGAPLGAALVRDRSGHALALSNERGEVDLDLEEAAIRDLALELSSGAVYAAAMRPGSVILARKLSQGVKGRIRFLPRDGADPLAASVSPERPTSYYWLESDRAWRAGAFRAASPLGRSGFGAFNAELLDGEALWFAAAGYGYAHCTKGHLEVLGREFGKDDGGGSPCPILLPAREVRGSVVDEGGRPVADTEILIDWALQPENPLTVIRGDVPGASTASLMLLRSDASGHFATDRVGGRISASFLAFAGLRAERSGYLPVGRQPIESFAEEDGYRIRLSRGAVVTGQIVDGATGDPLVGADVSVGRFASAGRPLVLGPIPGGADGPFGRVRSGRSRADGSFEVSSWSGRWDVLVRAAGMAQRQLRGVDVTSGGVDLGIVEVRRGLGLEGVVLAETGHPISGAQVRVAGAKARGLLGGRDRVSTRFRNGMLLRSDELGEFVIKGLTEGARVDVLVSATGFVPTVVEQLSPERPQPLEVRLRRGASITVEAQFEGQPVAGRVSLRSQTGELSRHAVLQADGSFSFEDLAPGRYSVAVEAAGIKRWRRSVTAHAGEKVEMHAELEPEDSDGILHGRVTAGGAGIPGVEVRAGRRRTSTAVNGEYSFEGLGSGPYVVVVEPGAGYLPRSREVRIDGRSRRVDFDISRFRVAGRASWDDGAAVRPGELLFGSSFEMRTGATTRVDHDGSFEVELEEGEYVVSMRPVHGRGGRAVSRLRVAGPVSDADIWFRRHSRLTGRVEGLDADEFERLLVEAVNADEFDHRVAEVGGDGRFEIGDVAAGSWVVVATVGGSERRADRRVLTVGGEEVDVVLRFERRFKVDGVVRLDGQPFSTTQVVLIEGADWASVRRTWTGLDGSFTFRGLDRGRYFVGVGAGVREVSVRGNEHLALELRSGVIRGRVDTPGTGLPAVGAEVLVWPSEVTRIEAERFGFVQRTYTDSVGEFRFDRIPQGAWNVEAGAWPGFAGTTRVESGPSPYVVLGGSSVRRS